jgi:hypothetical protein
VKILNGARKRVAIVAAVALGFSVLAAGPASAITATPTTPTNPANDGACATDASAPFYANANEGLTIEAQPNASNVTGTTGGNDIPVTEVFQIWPVDNPSQITSYTLDSTLSGLEGQINVSASVLADGQTYAWDAQTQFGGQSSDWMAPCYVAIDNTPPSAAPTVISANYPANQLDQPGAPIQFTFGANGMSDVAGYSFAWLEYPSPGSPRPISDPFTGWAATVAAPTLGGSATVDLVPPFATGFASLYVSSMDRAGNSSPVTEYVFYLKPTTPSIKLQGPVPKFGTQTEFQLRANAGLEAQSPVTSFTVETLSDSGETTQTIPASDDGVAEFKPTIDSADESFIVSTTSADGWQSDTNWYFVNTAPTVSSTAYPENGNGGGSGVSGTFTFKPPVKGVVSYSYSFDWGSTYTTVQASPNGEAEITWTPPQSGFYDLNVYATTANGTQLLPYDYFFTVN